MDTLKATFEAIIEGYTGERLNGHAYLVHDLLMLVNLHLSQLEISPLGDCELLN